jgi:hypothetical protein
VWSVVVVSVLSSPMSVVPCQDSVTSRQCVMSRHNGNLGIELGKGSERTEGYENE